MLVASGVDFLVMKAHALASRDKPKGARPSLRAVGANLA